MDYHKIVQEHRRIEGESEKQLIRVKLEHKLLELSIIKYCKTRQTKDRYVSLSPIYGGCSWDPYIVDLETYTKSLFEYNRENEEIKIQRKKEDFFDSTAVIDGELTINEFIQKKIDLLTTF